MRSKVLKRFLSSDDQKEEMALQITSMADIFTIILIFLLKTFATGITTITPSQGMVLPQVVRMNQSQMKEAVKIEILPETILLDTKPVLRVHNFEIAPEQLAESKTALVNPVSFTIIEALVKVRTTAAAGHSTTHVVVLAHEDAPYSTVRTVMNSAASAGYGDLQLVVVGSD
ncbi:MAG TPA: biopolymer transporter ExbD [Bdellovibrionota bacterium]|nr:biopolymer transporter ExbD [Bdellovibrionota bacterium]